jgi:hypothetical protein
MANKWFLVLVLLLLRWLLLPYILGVILNLFGFGLLIEVKASRQYNWIFVRKLPLMLYRGIVFILNHIFQYLNLFTRFDLLLGFYNT